MNVNVNRKTETFDKLSDSDIDSLIAKAENSFTKSNTSIVKESVQVVTEEVPEEKDMVLPIDSLTAGIQDLKAESEVISKELHQKQEEIKREIESKDEASNVEDVINSINADADAGVDKIAAEDNIGTILEKYEKNKVYVQYTDKAQLLGPADYTIETNEAYDVNIETILKGNNMNIVTKKQGERDAILERYTNSGDSITIPLVNSGIYVKVTGAGTTEIVAMASMNTEDEVADIINKLNFINNHIVSSTVGKMKIGELLKIVSYYDLDTLFYALFAATYPSDTEHSRVCPYCKQTYYLQMDTSDMLLNSNDFDERSSEIRDYNTTLSVLKANTQLSKIYKVNHDNGMIIYYRHPSIYDYVVTLKRLNPEVVDKYSAFVECAFAISKIALYDKGNDFIEIDDPNEIVQTLAKLKNPDDKYEILYKIEDMKPATRPEYGYPKLECPHCAKAVQQEAYSMSSLLFFIAKEKENYSIMKYYARLEEKKKLKKKN